VKGDFDTQIYISVIDTPDKEATLMRNWPLWEAGEQFQSGFPPSAENFLAKGYWRQPPKERAGGTGAGDYPEWKGIE
jgi:hypothetical protein